MSSSRQREEDVIEEQNDQRLDELHSKIRTLRGVTADIHADVESQNLILDDTGDSFSNFGSSLVRSSQRAARAFGLGPGGVKQTRIILYTVGVLLALWVIWKIGSWWIWGGSE